ncbi:signal peptidase I [Bacillus fonticola]|uniref:signal peptidase I n=1 Tax=Bacillus fonticola TaxID=2728853 RepID=UPI001474C34C|nr:signal peptidase I [Bacillus fonticola]
MSPGLKKEGLEWIKAFAIGILLFLLIRTFLFSSYEVEGKSMVPTLQDGDKLIVSKIGYTIGEIDRLDVIVFHATETEDYVKRVIGLPGDSIRYENDQLFVNDQPIPEPFLDESKGQWDVGTFTGDFTLEGLESTNAQTVPEGKIFVLGDNRLGSRDSRHFGFVDIDEVVGQVSLRFWPFKEITVSF